MLRPLHEAQRRRMLTWSALLCAIPLCLAPLAGRSSFELASEQAAFNTRFSTPPLLTVWNDKPVAVSRDPFLPEHSENVALPPQPEGIVGTRVTQGSSIGFVLPPNRGAAGTPVQDGPPSTSTVTAIVTGPSPRALLDDGAHVRVVSVGDVLAGLRIVAIDPAGVHLQNGTVMPLAEENP